MRILIEKRMKTLKYDCFLIALVTNFSIFIFIVSINFPIKIFSADFYFWHLNVDGNVYSPYCDHDSIRREQFSSNRNYITASFRLPGGLGNQIWRFASLYGIGQEINRSVYFDGKNIDQMTNLTELVGIFPMLGQKIFIRCPIKEELTNFAVDCCKYDDPQILKNLTSPYIKTSGDYLQSYKFFHAHRRKITKTLTCSKNVMQNVRKSIDSLLQNDTSYMLCAHIRRTDFIPDFMLESKIEFVQPAIEFAFEYLRKNITHKNISLLLFGDDEEFIRNISTSHLNFSTIYFLKPTNRGEVFCLAKNYCNSLLMTASGSTFAWWIAYLLPENATIFYNSQVTDNADFSKDKHDYDIFLPEWIRLTLAKNGTIFRENQWWYEQRTFLNRIEIDNKIVKIGCILVVVCALLIFYYWNKIR